MPTMSRLVSRDSATAHDARCTVPSLYHAASRTSCFALDWRLSSFPRATYIDRLINSPLEYCTMLGMCAAGLHGAATGPPLRSPCHKRVSAQLLALPHFVGSFLVHRVYPASNITVLDPGHIIQLGSREAHCVRYLRVGHGQHVSAAPLHGSEDDEGRVDALHQDVSSW